MQKTDFEFQRLFFAEKVIDALAVLHEKLREVDIEIADFVFKDVMLFQLDFQFDMKIKMASPLCTHYRRKCLIKVSFTSLFV